MKYTDKDYTVIVTAGVADNLRKLSQMMDRGDTDGQFQTELSATGNTPATHFVSSGRFPKAYITAISDPDRLKTAADAAYLAEATVQPFSLAQITTALSKCTISDGTTSVLIDGVPTTVAEDPHALIARLGLKIIQGTP